MEELILNDNRYGGIKSAVPLFAEREEKGVAIITRFKYEDRENPLFNLRAIRDGGWMFKIYDGHYVRLHVAGQLMMSDTGLERWSNQPFIRHANGRVLIAGLGIGLVINNIINKPEVKEIVCVEKYQDVIDLVSPKFPTVKMICADIFDWRPEKGEKFDVIYFDIWPEISTDNLADIKRLHNNFKYFVNRENPDYWMDSWMKEYLQTKHRQERQESAIYDRLFNRDQTNKLIESLKNPIPPNDETQKLKI